MFESGARADRFVVEELVGEGGMGAIYRARDTESGDLVALKRMTAGVADPRRFVREARLLSEVEHPAIVRYVAHGVTDGGEPFLAMEWLDGADLSFRIASDPLTIDETIALATQIAGGLAAVHERGIVHRDVKPPNVFLPRGDARRAKLVDFGIARALDTSTSLTKTGLMVGTVGYMAPEQARGSRVIDGRTDLFSLGCVLYECLTGTPPFRGPTPVAVLAKVLLDDVPNVRRFRADVPDALASLIERLLQKDMRDRPASAIEVARAIAGIDPVPSRDRAPVALREGEQRFVTTMLVAPIAITTAATVAAAELDDEARAISAIAARFGGTATPLIDGSVVVAMHAGEGAAELASRAALCALALRNESPRALVLTTARGGTTAQASVGAALDRGAGLLAGAGEDLLIDDVTAGLLRARFRVEPRGDAWVLEGERTEEWVAIGRRLLGRDVPCVGRRKEISLLAATFDEVEADSVARVVLVTGAAGIGKSRVALELLALLETRPHAEMIARATPLTMESAGALAATLVRSAVGLREGAAEQHEALRSHLSKLRLDDPERVREFLGELLAVPSGDPPSVALRAARGDMKIMHHWVSRSFVEWLEAECALRPVVIVIEDLHWADAASVSFIDGALAQLRDAPLFVLALARPEVHERLPTLWARAAPVHIALGGLTKRAAADLAKAALPDVDAPTVARVVDRADGNPFFLEELVRAVAAGRSELPDSVLAVVEERITRLDAETRRALRAASIFGEACWLSGVAHVIGDARAELTRALLDELVREEILEANEESRYEGQRQLSFRHALIRDAAYGMLPEGERRDAHGLAAEWLERAGERSAALLGEHWARAGRDREARACFVAAARDGLESGDVPGALRHVARASALAPDASEVAVLGYIELLAVSYAGEFRRTLVIARDALASLTPRTREWYEVIGAMAHAAMSLEDPSALARALDAFGDIEQPIAPSAAAAMMLTAFATAMAKVGGADRTRPYLRALEKLEANAGDDAAARGWAKLGLALGAAYVDDDPGRAVQLASAAVGLLTAAGDPLGLSIATGVGASLASTLGQVALPIALAARAEALAAQGLRYGLRYGQIGAAATRLRSDPAGTLRLLDAIGELDEQATSHASTIAGAAALAIGDLDRVRTTIARLDRRHRPSRVTAEILGAALALEEGRASEAAAQVDAIFADAHDGAGNIAGRAHLHLLAIRAALAMGDREAAARLAARAMERLERIAANVSEDDREVFWRGGVFVPETVAAAGALRGA
jgi:hypothetical protein